MASRELLLSIEARLLDLAHSYIMSDLFIIIAHLQGVVAE